MRIIQPLEKYFASPFVTPPSLYCEDNPTLQNLDTSLISLLKGTDECGRVNNFDYSEDNVVNIYDDPLERSTETEHELSYFNALQQNVVDNQQVNTENSPSTSIEPTVNVESTSEP